MESLKQKLYPKSVKGKILAGFLLGFIAIILAFGITKFAFQDMMGTVEELTEPNEKLTVLNRVFQEVAMLDQLQRAEAIKNPKKPHKTLLNESQKIVALIDSLMLLEWDSVQLSRLNSMKEVIQKRDELFFSYLKLKSNLIENKNLTKKIDTLSTIIEQKKVEIDTSVVTTQKKTTTTYVRDTLQQAKDQRSFIGKLFGKKKKAPAEETTQVKVQEELSVSIDTLAIAKQNKALEEVEKIVHALEADQRTQNKKFIDRELELIHANNHFINDLLNILHQVEKEELALMQKRNDHASSLVDLSIARISILLLIFFLGAALLVYLIWIDISNSNYYKVQLEKARDEAEELSQIKQRFLANMSHEIRTPLQSIIGFADQIKLQQNLDREAVNAIHSSSEHLLQIVNEVLDYSRISSGNFTLAKENFELMAVVKEVESAMRIQSQRKNLALVINSDHASDYALLGDSFRLRQILYNILGNAIKFTTTGSVKLNLHTVDHGKFVSCTFEIIDTGLGIRKEDLGKIFNQFEQADNTIAKNFGGTGLGLTIVKQLIEAQGGSLAVDSELGKGSTFTINIKFEKSEQVAPQEVIMPETVATTRAGRVLVVDDDQMILRLCELILKKNDVEHVIYTDAENLLNEEPDPAVTHIFMDIRMPKISGIELCHALKKKYPSQTQFIALTAHVFNEERKALYEEGFDIVLTKPFRETDLLKILGISTTLSMATPNSDLQFDLNPLRELTLNDDALLQSVLNQFIEETQGDLEKLEGHLKFQEKSFVRDVIHKLAGRIGQIGMISLSDRLKEIENKLVEGQSLSTLQSSIRQAADDLHKLLQNVQDVTLEQQR